MALSFQNQEYTLKRYPSTTNRSLQAWSAADEHILNYLSEEEEGWLGGSLGIWHDRFGALTTALHAHGPVSVITYHSQEIAIHENLQRNKVERAALLPVLEKFPSKVQVALLRIPKSLDLYRFYLQQMAEALEPEGGAVSSFMTRHFSPQLLNIASEYFESVEQSRAWKKSRLLLMGGPKKGTPEIPLTEIESGEGRTLKQYPGVFSANQVDPATRLLLEHLRVTAEDQRILDLGCGNGIIAAEVDHQFAERELHLLDDSYLAIASATLNLPGANAYFHTQDTLEGFEEGFFDMVVSNPPFHLEHENNIEVSLRLFREVHRCLKVRGSFQLVANRHLNYPIHLRRLFLRVEVVVENERFGVYDCRK